MTGEVMSNLYIEEGKEIQLDFKKINTIAASGSMVIPAIAQDSKTGLVLIVGYANKEAIEASLKENIAVFYSTSRNQLWRKGLTSGDTLKLDQILVNCEQNSVLYQVTPLKGSACHTKDSKGKNRKSCFYRRLKSDGLLFLPEID